MKDDANNVDLISNGQSKDVGNKQTDADDVNSHGLEKHLPRKQEIIQAFKFVGFSLSAGIIQILSFTILQELIFTFDQGNEYGLSYFISLALSIIWNFTFNRKFTFKSANNIKVAMLKAFAFYLVFTPLSILWGIALTNAGWNDYLVLVLTMLVNFATEFLYSKYVTFRDVLNKNDQIENSQKIAKN